MKDFVNIFLLVVQIYSTCIVVVLCAFSLYAYIAGYEKEKEILEKYKIPLNRAQMLAIVMFFTIAMITARIVRAALLGKL